MAEKNPVVLLSGHTWHIVEDGRRAQSAWCGQPLRERRAHARLSQVGEQNICPACWQLFVTVNKS